MPFKGMRVCCFAVWAERWHGVLGLAHQRMRRSGAAMSLQNAVQEVEFSSSSSGKKPGALFVSEMIVEVILHAGGARWGTGGWRRRGTGGGCMS
jgi:hypothetical protein